MFTVVQLFKTSFEGSGTEEENMRFNVLPYKNDFSIPQVVEFIFRYYKIWSYNVFDKLIPEFKF